MAETPLIDTLRLEQIEVNLFRGTTPDSRPGRIFGGQVIAQSLLAAYGTVEERLCHSLHCYFLRPGDPTVPIIFEVDRARDGGSFTSRRVIAVQHGQQIFNLAASFQKAEVGLEHQSPMPAAPPPEEVQDDFALAEEVLKDAPPAARAWLRRSRPIELRTVGGRPFGFDIKPMDPHQQLWFRAKDPIGADPVMQQIVMAYASDMSLLGTTLRAHGVNWLTPGLQPASIDHAMWFHRPTNFNDWHLFVLDSPSASGARGFNRGSIYAADGTLVASAVQEGLVRIRAPKV